jgi:hypothetical protein
MKLKILSILCLALTFLFVQQGSGQTITAALAATNSQSFSADADTLVEMNSVMWNVGMTVNITNSTITVPSTGIYRVTGVLSVADLPDGKYYYGHIYTNASVAHVAFINSAGTTVNHISSFSAMVSLNANDVIKIIMAQNNPSSISTIFTPGSIPYFAVDHVSDGSSSAAPFTNFIAYDSSATFTNTFAVSTILVEAWGAGAGGGGGATVIGGGGGGGGGSGYVRGILSVTNNQQVAFTVGVGGSGGGTGSSGSSGGNTTISTFTANGGSGGAAGTATIGGTGGASGNGSGATEIVQGKQGGAGIPRARGTSQGGVGGASGKGGTTPGGGGNGGNEGNSGNAGNSGRVIIWY